jgi:hypothetical protein
LRSIDRGFFERGEISLNPRLCNSLLSRMIMSFIMRSRGVEEKNMAEKPIKLFATRAERYPEPSGADVALGTGRAVLAAIPLVGGSITEVLSLVLAPAVSRRRDTWLKELADGLEEAERQIDGFTIENLTQDEAFISAVIEATRSAISTHKDEKRDALLNGLLNIALHRSTDEDQQQTFLRYIEELTVWHLRILRLFQNPSKHLSTKGLGANYYMGSASQVLTDFYPELADKRELYDQIAADLASRGLVGAGFLHGMMSAQGMVAKRTSALADRFLDFIPDPLHD